ncbi:MAG: hypothetical protein ACRDH7_07965 [Actinomycetota bacterium]
MSRPLPVRPESPSDEELRGRRLRDPEVQDRLRQIHEQIEGGETSGPGLSQDELQDFLREQRSQLDP